MKINTQLTGLCRIAGILAIGMACMSWTAGVEPAYVSTAEALIKAVASAKPGHEIVVKAGEYTLKTTLTIRAQGSKTAPVTIRSEKPGAAVLKGTHTISLRGAKWVTVEGFVFAHQLLPAKAWLRILECEDVRISRCRFAFDESGATEKDHYHSVGIEKSTHVRVDHCEFGPRTTRSMGDYVSTHLGSRHLRVDHNYFKHRANINKTEVKP